MLELLTRCCWFCPPPQSSQWNQGRRSHWHRHWPQLQRFQYPHHRPLHPLSIETTTVHLYFYVLKKFNCKLVTWANTLLMTFNSNVLSFTSGFKCLKLTVSTSSHLSAVLNLWSKRGACVTYSFCSSHTCTRKKENHQQLSHKCRSSYSFLKKMSELIICI